MLGLLVSAIISSSVPEGSVVPIYQWCDELKDAQEVVDYSTKYGYRAATEFFEVKVAQHKCHSIPPQLATEGLLVNPVTQDLLEFPGADAPFVLEIWLAIVNGTGRDHDYVFVMYPVEVPDTKDQT